MEKRIMERTPRLGLIGAAIAISMAILLPAAVSVAQPVSFDTPTAFLVGGGGATSIAIGDLNGDGHPDLAVANEYTVSILLGTATGTFDLVTTVAELGWPAVSVAIGDFNTDGHLDLAVVTRGNGSVSILLGTGTGAFGPATVFGTGGASTSMIIGDLNGDGHPDLAMTNYSIKTIGYDFVSTLLGTGTGAFGAPTRLALERNHIPRFVAIGDLNGDGQPDVAVTTYNAVSIFFGTGAGAFGPRTNVTAEVGTSFGSVAIGDFNGDGRPDLAVTTYNSTTVSGGVSILLGTGTGAFGPGTNVTVEVGGTYFGPVAIGDVNGDGQPDLAVTTSNSTTMSGGVSILLGTGTGAFGPATDFATGMNPASVTIRDLNGDGKPDLAVIYVRNGTITISFLLNSTPVPVQTFTLTVRTAGTGGGTVTSTPAGITCGATCSAPFDSGTVVTLTATSEAPSTFAGWSGACTGTGTCTVTMSAAPSVTATWTRQFATDTRATTTVTATSATITGIANPQGAVGTAWFEYGPTPAYGSTTISRPVSGSADLPVGQDVTGLAQGTMYHYRVCTQVSSDIACGADASFTTRSATLGGEGNISLVVASTAARIDGYDLIALGLAFGANASMPHWNPLADLNGDGMVDGTDLAILAVNFGRVP